MDSTPSSFRKQDPVAQAVADAIATIETAVLPPPPGKDYYAWRLRPSQLRALAMEDFQNPPPVWGLRVNLASLCIGPSNCNAIARSLILCKTVTSIDLSMCDMQTDAAIHLFFCLQRNENVLKHLNISGNFIEAAGGIAASACVGQLESLHMACNCIGDVGAAAIARALKKSKTMKFLNVRSNKLSNLGVWKLMRAIDPAVDVFLSDALKEELRGLDAEFKLQRRIEASAHRNNNGVVKGGAGDATSSPLGGLGRSQLLGSSTTPRGNGAPSLHGSVRAMPSSKPSTPQLPQLAPRSKEVLESSRFRRETSKSFGVFATHESPTLDPHEVEHARFAASIALGSSLFLNKLLLVRSQSSVTRKGVEYGEATVTLDNNDDDYCSDKDDATTTVGNLELPEHCTSVNAMWVQLNDGTSPELTTRLNNLLATRFPQPPDGFNSKKKKKKRGGSAKKKR